MHKVNLGMVSQRTHCAITAAPQSETAWLALMRDQQPHRPCYGSTDAGMGSIGNTRPT